MQRDGFEKGDRIIRLIELVTMFQGAPGGLTTSALAERVGVNQRTIQRDIKALGELLGVPFYQEGGRWKVVQNYWLRPVAFSLQEAVGLLLSLRLMVRYADKADALTASAFEKLAAVLPQEIRQAVTDSAYWLRTRVRNDVYARALSTLATAWAQRKQVDIKYAGRDGMRRVWPLWLEPSAVGHSCYLLAWDPRARAPRVFKVERIEAIRLLETGFEPPAGFSPAEFLAEAWGIWGSADPIEVELLFDANAAPRVRESIWHPTQQLQEERGGRLRMTLRVGHWLEIRPWVLSWGDACEVLQPAELRDSVGDMARNLAAKYDRPPDMLRFLEQSAIQAAKEQRKHREDRRETG